MFKAPVYKSGEDIIHLRSTGRINRLAGMAIEHGHKMEPVPCVNIRVGDNDYATFDWNDFLRDAYLALNRLPDDDVEAHHIKGMLTKAVEMFQGKIAFERLEYSVTMGTVKELKNWEVDIIAGYENKNTPLESASRLSMYGGQEPTENPMRLKFRLDISREIGLVPMQELHRALASLPFDITVTTPTERATMFDKVPQLCGMMINVIPADEMTDYCRFRLQYTFDKVITDQVARDLIKERMQERKIGGTISWQIDSLVITATCAEQDTLVEAIQWRCKVEEELLEVLASMTCNDNKFIR